MVWVDLRLQVLEEPVDGALVEQQALDPLHHGAPSGQLVGPAARGARPARHAAPRAALGARHGVRWAGDWPKVARKLALFDSSTDLMLCGTRLLGATGTGGRIKSWLDLIPPDASEHSALNLMKFDTFPYELEYV